MIDFNGNKLSIGDTIFFTHRSKQSILGRISLIEGKKTITVFKDDVLKAGPKYNPNQSGVVVNSDDVIKIN
jgi:hypothetical protein